MKVKATLDGFYRGDRIRAGREFVLREGDKLAKWMQPLEQPAEEVKAKKPKAEKPAEEKAE